MNNLVVEKLNVTATTENALDTFELCLKTETFKTTTNDVEETTAEYEVKF